jgi:hypothetical protein
MQFARHYRLILAAAVVIHLVLVYLALSRQLDFLFNDASHRAGPGSDFVAMYVAGDAWRAGDEIYGQGPGFGFRYHPFAAMTLFASLAKIPAQAAYYLWAGLTELLLLAAMVVIGRLLADKTKFAIFALGSALTTPLYLEIYMGNASLLAISILIIAFYFDRQGKATTALVALIVSCLVKPIGVLLLPLLILKGRFKPALLLLGILLLLGVPYWMKYPDSFEQMLIINCTDQQTLPGFLVHAGNQGMHAFLTRLGAWVGDLPLSTLQSLEQLPVGCEIVVRLWPILLALVVGYVTWVTRREENDGLILYLCLTAYLLGYKDIWEHSYVILVLALPLLWMSGKVDQRALLVGFLLVALPTAFALYDLPFSGARLHDPDWHWSNGISLIHHATKPVGAIYLFMLTMQYLLKLNSVSPGQHADRRSFRRAVNCP